MSIEIVPAQFSTVGLTGYISAGTTNASLGTVVFSNSNGVSFGMNAGIVTASVVAGAAAGIGAVGAGSQTQTSGTLVFANSNNITFGMSGSSQITASYGGGAGGGIAAAAGTQTQTSGTMAFVNSNGISFGMSNSSQITASYTVPTQTVQTQNLHNATVSGNSTSSGATGYAQISSGTMTLVGGNNITIMQDGNRIELSGANAGGAQTGISSVALSNTTYTSGQISFSDANGISFGTGAGQAINITHGLQYTSATSAITSNALHSSASKVAGIVAGTASNGGTATLTGDVSFSNANGISFYTSAGNAVVGTVRTDYQSAGAYLTTARASNDAIGLNTALTANGLSVTANSSGLSINVPAWLTTAAQSNHSHNLATTTTNGSLVVVATTNSAGATVAVPPYITTYAAQTNQTGNLYVSGNTTQLSSTAGIDLRSISFEGAGIASVGVSNGRVLVSVPSGGGAGDGYNIVYAGTAGTTGTTWSSASASVRINGGNNITVSQNGSNDIVISAAQGGIAAGTQTATSGTLVFANSNGVTFGMSGSSQITASVNAGGAAVTLSQWEPFRPIGGGVAFSTMGLNTIYLQRLPADVNVQFSYIERRMSGSTVSSTNSQSCRHTYDYGIYSRMTGTNSTQYSLAGSSRLIFMASVNSNASAGYTISQGAASLTNTSAGTGNMASLTGYKHMYFPFTSTITAGGEYAIAFRMSSATTVGTNALRVAFQELSVINNLTIGKIHATTVIASNASHVGDFAQGVYSVTSGGLPDTLALSGLTNAVSQQRMYLQFD